MKYAIVNYPIPEDIIQSGLIAQTNLTARKNNSNDKCIVSYNESYSSVFRGYPTLAVDDLATYLANFPKEWNPEYQEDIEPSKNYPVPENVTPDGKVLYIKVHGVKAQVAAGESHIFTFQNPYPEVYFFGAEIMQDIIGVADFDVFYPIEGHPDGGVPVEQYGFDVNLGTIKYIRETRFAARLPQGLITRCAYTNDTDEEQEVGVNFLMNELRDDE